MVLTGKADAGEYGDIDVDAAYFGGYYCII